MTIRARLTLWYATMLSISLLLISGGVFQELYEQLKHSHRPASERHALNETSELVFEIGLPALVLGLFGAWWLTHRALSPIRDLIGAMRVADENSLKQPLPRSGNGDELDQLTAVLNDANARLNVSFTRIREFTLHASHELKTPLTVMRSELETILGDTSATPSQREHVLSQLDEVRRLSRIVDGLTLLTKADAGQVPLKHERVRFDELVRDAHADAVVLGESRGLKVRLTTCDQVTLMGDRDRLRQLLLNLVDNAVKYADANGLVEMALACSSGHAHFRIANSGPGIAPGFLPRVFDRFFRGDPAHSTSIDGCGLGLSIAQWIVSAHHGTITLDSVPLQTTTVSVLLPLDELTKPRQSHEG